MNKIQTTLVVIGIALWFGLAFGVGYVAMHFVIKFW